MKVLPCALDCECDDCNEAAHNLPCMGCDCCASGDCAALFCADCPCTSVRRGRSSDNEETRDA